jgi:hypothetical protein
MAPCQTCGGSPRPVAVETDGEVNLVKVRCSRCRHEWTVEQKIDRANRIGLFSK